MKKIILTVIAVLTGITLSYAESCKDSPVKTEYKPDIENCKSQKRTCCEDGNWSEWDKECEKHDGCYNGKEWEAEPDCETEYSTDEVPKNIKKTYGSDYYTISPYARAEVSSPIKYTRHNCKCEEGKGWKCQKKYKPISVLEYKVRLQAKVSENDCDNTNSYSFYSANNCGTVYAQDSKQSFELGTSLAKSLGVPRKETFYERTNTIYQWVTPKLNGAQACKGIYKFKGIDWAAKEGSSNISSSTCTIMPDTCYFNGEINGNQAYVAYEISCSVSYYPNVAEIED